MPKVVTQDDIIGRFKGVHGDRYDYSKTVYNGSKQKVVVTCKEHGLKVYLMKTLKINISHLLQKATTT